MLSDNLRLIRLYRRLTQKELANRLGVAQPTVWEWENNGRGPNEKRLDQLTKELNCTADQLLCDDLLAKI